MVLFESKYFCIFQMLSKDLKVKTVAYLDAIIEDMESCFALNGINEEPPMLVPFQKIKKWISEDWREDVTTAQLDVVFGLFRTGFQRHEGNLRLLSSKRN